MKIDDETKARLMRWITQYDKRIVEASLALERAQYDFNQTLKGRREFVVANAEYLPPEIVKQY
jgi:hypothetical protein